MTASRIPVYWAYTYMHLSVERGLRYACVLKTQIGASDLISTMFYAELLMLYMYWYGVCEKWIEEAGRERYYFYDGLTY